MLDLKSVNYVDGSTNKRILTICNVCRISKLFDQDEVVVQMSGIQILTVFLNVCFT